MNHDDRIKKKSARAFKLLTRCWKRRAEKERREKETLFPLGVFILIKIIHQRLIMNRNYRSLEGGEEREKGEGGSKKIFCSYQYVILVEH